MSEQHEHEWLERGQRQVRNCDECKATQIRSLADGRWHAYISGDEVQELSDLRTQLTEAISHRQSDHDLAEWARKSLASTKKLHAEYCAPANDEDPVEVKWRFGITANGYELYKGPYVEDPHDPDAEGIVDTARTHAVGMRDLAARLNDLEAHRQSALDAMASALEKLTAWACPCALGEPCQMACTCAQPHMSGGCVNPQCPRLYGRQRLKAAVEEADRLRANYDAAIGQSVEDKAWYERELAAANQDAEMLAETLARAADTCHNSDDITHFCDLAECEASRCRANVAALASHRARLASQPPAEAEGA